jgi:small glutamine-rich tetratricopeptide repeat-containing protein alpha
MVITVQCIGEAFGVDPSDEAQVAQLSCKPTTLKTVFDVFLKTRERTKQGGSSSAADAAPAASSSTRKTPSTEDKAEAEKLKAKGNQLMTSKKYDEAIAMYDQAVAHDPTNPVYFSNRAAAHASKGDHLSAIGDAEEAISLDPNFVKAYSRLGYVNKLGFREPSTNLLYSFTRSHAQYSLGDFEAAASAFERGLKLEPTNANLKGGLENAKARLAAESSSLSTPDSSSRSAPTGSTAPPAAGGVPNLSDLMGSLGGMFGGGGAGGGAGGGMPDLASMMQNPELMRMAGQLAANGGLERMMQDPNIAAMAERFRGGGLPSQEDIRQM